MVGKKSIGTSVSKHLTFPCDRVTELSDEIAKKRRVFKVETIGDCYVAGEYPWHKTEY